MNILEDIITTLYLRWDNNMKENSIMLVLHMQDNQLVVAYSYWPFSPMQMSGMCWRDWYSTWIMDCT
jgi:hypothetical protein